MLALRLNLSQQRRRFAGLLRRRGRRPIYRRTIPTCLAGSQNAAQRAALERSGTGITGGNGRIADLWKGQANDRPAPPGAVLRRSNELA
jgi:hypothetical protein